MALPNWKKCREVMVEKIIKSPHFYYRKFNEVSNDASLAFADLSELSLQAQEQNFVKDLLMVSFYLKLFKSLNYHIFEGFWVFFLFSFALFISLFLFHSIFPIPITNWSYHLDFIVFYASCFFFY